MPTSHTVVTWLEFSSLGVQVAKDFDSKAGLQARLLDSLSLSLQAGKWVCKSIQCKRVPSAPFC